VLMFFSVSCSHPLVPEETISREMKQRQSLCL
jgi:hypothetical protein